MNPIAVGSVAPDFSLPDQFGHPFKISDARGKASVLLVFLPAAFTPLCTSTLPLLNGMLDDFLARGIWPVVVTVDNRHSNAAWCRELKSQRIRVLSDANPPGKVSRQFGILAPDFVSERSSFLIDPNGVVRISQIVGRDKQHDPRGLLNASVAILGGKPALVGAGILARPKVPQVFLTHACEHCRAVDDFLNAHGLTPFVAERWIDQSEDAQRDFAATGASGTPVMLLPNGSIIEGDQPIIRDLRQQFYITK